MKEASIGIQWVEVIDTASHPMTQKTVSHNKTYQDPSANSAEIEKYLELDPG